MTPNGTAIHDGLVATASGTSAVWRLGPVDSLGLVDDEALVATWDRLSSGIAQLPRRTVLHGVCKPLDPDAVTAAVAGTGPSADADRAAAASGATERWERIVYACAPLSEQNPMAAALSRVRSSFGVGASRSPTEWGTYTRQAGLAAAKAGDLQLIPASTEEISWLFTRLIRGGQRRRATTVHLREGAGRYVTADNGITVTWHTVMIVEDLGEWIFPGGGEWWRVCDMLPFPLDWAVFLDLIPNPEARRMLGRRRAELAYQDERETASEGTASRDLVAAVDSVEEGLEQLSAQGHIPMSEPTMLFWVSADSRETLEWRAETLRALCEGSDISLVRPLGAQRALLNAMAPASTLPWVAQGWSQLVMPRDLASGMPVVPSRIGDQRGALLGWQQQAATVPTRTADIDTTADRKTRWSATPVYYDPTAGPRRERSGAVGFVGDMGSGKSWTAKRLATDVYQQGGRVVVYDPTDKGEWSTWAKAIAPDAAVVTLTGEGGWDLDPLTLFRHRGSRERYALGLASVLTGTPPTGPEATALRAAVSEATDNGSRFVDLPTILDGNGTKVDRRIAADLRTVLDTELGRAALAGVGRRPQHSDSVTVFRVPDLSLPSREDLATDTGRKHLMPEQIVGVGTMYLLASLAYDKTMSDERFGVGIVEEAWQFISSSPRGRELVMTWARDTRKHNAGMWVLSQDVSDIDEGLRAQLRTRFVFRQAQGLGSAALEWLGMATTRQNLALVEQDFATGECVVQDLYGRLGVVSIEKPALRSLEEAISTTPVDTEQTARV